jgi:DNA replication ATP-dependent helicase Dna2
MVILHPDHLISATVVADAFGCKRRAVLQDRVKATGSSSAPMLYGNLLHEHFQEAMKINRWDMPTLRRIHDEALPRHFETLVDVGLDVNQVNEYITPKLIEMGAWASKFVRSAPTVRLGLTFATLTDASRPEIPSLQGMATPSGSASINC